MEPVASSTVTQKSRRANGETGNASALEIATEHSGEDTMRILNWVLIAVATYFNVLVAWAGDPTFNPPPIPGSTSIYDDNKIPAYEPYSAVTVPHPLRTPPSVPQSAAVSAACPNKSEFDGQCYDSNWNKIVPQQPTPQPSAPCNPCQTVKLNSDLGDIVTLTSRQAPGAVPATPAPASLPANPYQYQATVTGFKQSQPPASLRRFRTTAGPRRTNRSSPSPTVVIRASA